MWYVIDILILGLGVGLILLILKDKDKLPKKERYKRWLGALVVLIICGLLTLLTNHLETKSWNNLRYNTVEEMVAECMPEETIDYVLYYDKYAIIFLNNSNGQIGKWFSTYRDTDGWKATRGYIDRNMRSVSNFNKAELSFIEVDNQSGLDFVIFAPYFQEDLNEILNSVSDTAGSRFEYLRLPSGNEYCYTFVDVDQPGYEISANGSVLKVEDVNFFGGMANYKIIEKQKEDKKLSSFFKIKKKKAGF
jgi:hypothetical protein